MKRKSVLLALLLILTLSNAAQAMSSPNYQLDWLVPLTSAGGGSAESPNFAIGYTIGQTFINQSASVNYSLEAGFWQNFLQQFLIWLPFIRK